MSPSPAERVPELFDSRFESRPALPRSDDAARPRRRTRLGQRAILLTATNARGVGVLLAFTRACGGIAFSRCLSPDRSALERIATFPGPFTPHGVARLLASGAVRPAVDSSLAEDTWIEGVDDFDADLLRLAWCRIDGRVDPRAGALLALSPRALERACEHDGGRDLNGLLALGQRILDANREWIEKHLAVVDAEVDKRATATAAGEQERREIRAFVEECLVTLGRLPRSDETAGRWDGIGVAGRDLGTREARRLGLLQTGRSGRFRVWVRYWDGAGSIGRGEFGSGVGWYWDVKNPDPRWMVDGVMGPCDSAYAAWSDAAYLREQG